MNVLSVPCRLMMRLVADEGEPKRNNWWTGESILSPWDEVI